MVKHKSSRPSKAKDSFSKSALPISPSLQAEICLSLFRAVMGKFGVVCVESYFHKWRIAIAVSVVVCTALGGYFKGVDGFVWGLIGGLAAPAALVCIAIAVVCAAVYLALYVLALAVIFYGIHLLFSF